MLLKNNLNYIQEQFWQFWRLKIFEYLIASSLAHELDQSRNIWLILETVESFNAATIIPNVGLLSLSKVIKSIWQKLINVCFDNFWGNNEKEFYWYKIRTLWWKKALKLGTIFTAYKNHDLCWSINFPLNLDSLLTNLFMMTID